MENAAFQAWLSASELLTTSQREEALAALSGQSGRAASVLAVERGLDEERHCPHCDTPGAVRRGLSRGLWRYQCKGCGRTFNAVTGTPLSGLHKKDRWLSFGESLAEGETVRASAERRGIDPTTAFRWRHRFLKAAKAVPDKLKGIVEADETYVLESRTYVLESQKRPAEAGSRAPQAGWQGHQARPVEGAGAGPGCRGPLRHNGQRRVAGSYGQGACRRAQAGAGAGRAVGQRWRRCLSALRCDAERQPRGPQPIGLAIGWRSAGERVRGELHIQTVNNRHGRLKQFLHRRRGIASKYLESYLRWFHMLVLDPNPTSRTCLAAALTRPCMQFAN